MALLTSHSMTNRVVDTALSVHYSSHVVVGSWQQTSSLGITVNSWGRMLEHHRHATKSYRYVGLTYSAAKSCQSAMITKYTRNVVAPQWWDAFNGRWANDDTGAAPKELMASVTLEHQEDDAWDVVVQVNEDDVRMSLPNYSGTPKSMFPSSVTSRTYDGTGTSDTEETE